MLVNILQEELSKALLTAIRFTSSKVQLPILADVLLTTNKNKLVLSATNLETSISISLGAKVDSEGSVAIPAKTISDIVNNLKPGQLKIESEKETVKITSSGFESVLSGMDPSDFPKIPIKLGSIFVEFDKDTLVSSLSKVLFSVSTDETRPILNGVLMVFKDSAVTFVSTDGFRLSKKGFDLKASGLEKKVIIPKNTLSEVSKLSSAEKTISVSFSESEKQVIFGIGNCVLTSRVIEGDFPSYEKIIPGVSNILLVTDRDDFSSTIKLSGVLARDSANVIRVHLKKSQIEITSESQKSGKQKAVFDVKYEKPVSDDDFEIAFNYKFIEEFLNATNGDLVGISFIDSSSPGVFTDKSDENYLHLIMPVKI